MTTSRRRTPLRLIVPALAVALATTFLVGAAQADPTDPPGPAAGGPGSAGADTSQEVAEDALETVEDLLDPGTAPGLRSTDPVDPDEATDEDAPADLTMALRDLAVTAHDLPKNKQDDAKRLLARPTDAQTGNANGSSFECNPDYPTSFCYEKKEATPYCAQGNVCVHYLKGSQSTYPNAAAPEDDGPGGVWPGTKNNNIPDYVEYVGLVMSRIVDRYNAAGYRAPVGDGARGGGDTDDFDVYLADLGKAGYYGYCTTDQLVSGHTTAPGYCVLDNNYTAREYGTWNTPADNMRVTAAHEYFHAVQFAYDVNESAFFMEATATWAEDEVYTGINDNRQYLPYGPLGHPDRALGSSSGLAPYGAWIFFRHLSETWPKEVGKLPVIVRQIWEKAAGGPSSITAIEGVLADRGTNFRDEFARFATRNRRTSAFYSEGSAYPNAPLWKNFKPTAASRSAAAGPRTNPKSAHTVRFDRTAKLSGNWKIKLAINLANRTADAGYVTVKPVGKAARSTRLSLNASGNQTITTWFGPKTDWIEVTVVNAGTGGHRQKVTGTLVR